MLNKNFILNLVYIVCSVTGMILSGLLQKIEIKEAVKQYHHK